MSIVLDLIVIGLIALCAVRSWQRGFFKTVMGFGTIFLTILITILFTKPLAGIVMSMMDSPNVARVSIITAIVLFIVSYVAIKITIELLDKVFELPFLKAVNKLFGLALGAVIGVLWVCAICFVVVNLFPTFTSDTVVMNFFGRFNVMNFILNNIR